MKNALLLLALVLATSLGLRATAPPSTFAVTEQQVNGNVVVPSGYIDGINFTSGYAMDFLSGSSQAFASGSGATFASGSTLTVAGNFVLAGVNLNTITGPLYSTAGVPSAETAAQAAAILSGATATIDFSNFTLTFPPIPVQSGTSSALAITTLANNVLGWTTDSLDLFIGDGSTLGGDPVVRPQGHVIYVSKSFGSDTRYTSTTKLPQQYDPNRPYLTLTAANAAAVSGDTIVAVDGTFTDKNIIPVSGTAWVFEPNAIPVVTSATSSDVLFTDNGTAIHFSINGFGQTFTYTNSASSSTISGFSFTGASTVTINGINFTETTTSTSIGTGACCVYIATNNASLTWTNGTITSVPASSVSIGLNTCVDLNGSGTFLGNANLVGQYYSAAILNGGTNPAVVGTLVDGSTSAGSTTANALTILNPTPIVQALAAPSTGFTQAFTGGPQDQIMYITPSGTLASGTIPFPTDSHTRIKQRLTIMTTQIITSATISVSGGTIYGVPTTLAVGSVSFQKVASNVWTKL